MGIGPNAYAGPAPHLSKLTASKKFSDLALNVKFDVEHKRQ